MANHLQQNAKVRCQVSKQQWAGQSGVVTAAAAGDAEHHTNILWLPSITERFRTHLGPTCHGPHPPHFTPGCTGTEN